MVHGVDTVGKVCIMTSSISICLWS